MVAGKRESGFGKVWRVIVSVASRIGGLGGGNLGAGEAGAAFGCIGFVRRLADQSGWHWEWCGVRRHGASAKV